MSSFGKRKKMSSRKAGSSRPGKRMLAKGYASFKQSKAAASGIIGRSPATRGSRTYGPETKTVDVPGTVAGAADTLLKQISTTATFDLLNGVQEGASFYNRVGRKTSAKSVHITGQVLSTSLGVGVSDYCRIMLIYDRQPNGNFPSIGDILQDVDNQGNTVSSSYSKMNLSNTERFAILRDQRFQSVNNAPGIADNINMAELIPYASDQAKINWFVPLKGLETHFKASTNPAAIGDVATGALYLVTCGATALGSNGYALLYNSRFRFTYFLIAGDKKKK
jgi:hypothetical protein